LAHIDQTAADLTVLGKSNAINFHKTETNSFHFRF